MNAKEIQEEIIDEFAFFDDWSEKYEYIIELGKSIPTMDPAHKIEENKVKGCQSHVWLHADYDGEKIHYQADSEAMIVKGLVSLLLRLYNDRSPKEILSIAPDFIDAIGMKAHLSPTRSNGLSSMLKHIKAYAVAYQSKNAKTSV